MADNQQLTLRIVVNDDGSAVIKDFQGNVQGLSKTVEQSESSWKRAGTAANEFGGKILGGVMVSGMAAAGAAVALGIKNLAEFDDQMISVRKTTGMSVEEIAGLGDSLREMASAGGSLSGVTAMELGKIAEVAGQLGINGKENILAFSNTIAEMTIATGMSAEAAASGMAAVGNIFRDSLTANGQTVAEQMDNIGSGFDALEDSTNASAASIMDMVGKMGGAATQLGLSVDETAAIAATLADRGVDVEVAGTAMSKFFLDLLTNSENWAAAMKLDAQTFSEALKNDPAEAIQMVVEGMAKLKDTQGPAALAATLDDLGVKDTRLIGAMLKLGDAHADLERNTKAANEATAEGTRLHNSAAIASESSVKQYGLLKERMTEASRGVGELFEPMTAAALKFANEGLSKAIEGLGEIKTNGEDVGNFFGEAFGIDDFGTRIKDGFDAVTGTLQELTTDASGFGEELKNAFAEDLQGKWDSIKTGGADAFNAVKESIQGISFADVAASGDEFFDGLVTKFGLEGASDKFSAGLGTLKDAWAAYQTDSQGTTAAFFDEMVANFGIEGAYDQFNAGIDKVKAVWTDFTGQDWSQWIGKPLEAFDSLKSDAVAAVQGIGEGIKEIASGITDAIVAPFTAAKDKVKGAMDDIKSAVGMDTAPTLDFNAENAISQLSQLKDLIGGFSEEQSQLERQYKVVWEGMKIAIEDNREPSDQLKQRFVSLQEELMKVGNIAHSKTFPNMTSAMFDSQVSTQNLTSSMTSLKGEINAVGVEAYGNSTFPDMTAAIQTSGGATTELTAKMEGVRASVKQLEADYKAAQQSDKAAADAKKQSVDALTAQIDTLKAHTGDYWGLERDKHEEHIKQLEQQRDTAKSVSTSRQGDIDAIKAKLDEEKEKLKELEQAERELEKAEKARVAAVEFLADNTQRTGELRQQQIEEEQQAENELYRERQQQAADSIKWVGQLDEATQKRVLGEEDAVKVLQAQGVELTDLQQQELRRMQQAYQTEQAYEAQTAALAKQLGTSATLADIGGKMSESFGTLSSGIGNIGNLFNVDTSGITDMIGKMQGLAELPETIKGVMDSVKGIGEAFGKLKDLGGLKDLLKGGGGLSGLISGLGGIATVAGVVMAAWGPIKDFFKGLFEEHKSKGREASDAFQGFVKSNVEGGAQLAAAMGQARESMNFKDQFASLTADTYGLWNAFANTPIDGVNTGLQMLEQTMISAGVPTEKLGQVAIQTFAGMQNSGMGAAEMSKSLADMLGLTQAQADALSVALTGTAGSAGEYASAVENATAAAQTSVSSNESLASSTEGIAKGYATASQAIKAYQAELARAQMLASMGIPSAAVPKAADGGIVSGLAIVNERGSEIAKFPGGGMALMTQPGPVLGAFPAGTEIISHGRSMQILREYPTLPRMADGGTVSAMSGSINITIQNLVVQGQMGNASEMRRMADTLSREIATRLESRQRGR